MTATRPLDTLSSAHVELLARLDPSDVDFHAARYDSASRLSLLMANARRVWSGGNSQGMTPTKEDVYTICWTCKEDGADYGFIPCLGGAPLAAWKQILSDMGITTYSKH